MVVFVTGMGFTVELKFASMKVDVGGFVLLEIIVCIVDGLVVVVDLLVPDELTGIDVDLGVDELTCVDEFVVPKVAIKSGVEGIVIGFEDDEIEDDDIEDDDVIGIDERGDVLDAVLMTFEKDDATVDRVFMAAFNDVRVKASDVDLDDVTDG